MSNPPKPAELRVIEGNRSRRPIPDVPPPVVGVPEPPEFLKGSALAEWHRLIGIMTAMGTLGLETLGPLTIYCRAWQRMIECEAHVASHGEIVAAPRTGVPMQNPYLSIANNAAATVARMASEFGFTPVGRVRLALPAGSGQGAAAKRPLSPAERWFDKRA